MNTKLIEWILRVSVAGEFIGHGVFALQGKQAWIEWFASFGIVNPELARQLLSLIGLMDLAEAHRSHYCFYTVGRRHSKSGYEHLFPTKRRKYK